MADEEVEWVEMTHPGMGKDQEPATVARSAFEAVWEGKGWVIKDDSSSKSKNKNTPANPDGV